MRRRRGRSTPRRVRRNGVLLAVSAGIMIAADLANPATDPITRASFASAYAAMVLLCASLVVGPLNVLRERPNPTSTHLRRDIGIWAGSLALVHSAIGLNVHLRGRWWEYFIVPRDDGVVPLIRTDAFGLANHTGLLTALILALLLALSNDASLRRLGTRRWKALQRWNYGGFALILVHAVIYQLLEERSLPWQVVLGAMAGLTITLQSAGFLKRRERG